MSALDTRRMKLPTGVTLHVQVGGAGEPIIFLHGFPESHRTWRHQMADLSPDFHVVAPDQRGFGGSDRPHPVREYRTEKPIADLFALADTLGIGRFTLVGHDWGGAVAWGAALERPERLKRLVIVNAPHPYVFQKSLFTSRPQRRASRYIRLFRVRSIEMAARAIGYRKLADRTFDRMAGGGLPDEERDRYARDWSRPGAMRAMLNWYRASRIKVPPVWAPTVPPNWLDRPFPKVTIPTLVIWGLRDKALLPIQLDGLRDHVEDLRIRTAPDAGHFITWEKPGFVTQAIREFIAETPLD